MKKALLVLIFLVLIIGVGWYSQNNNIGLSKTSPLETKGQVLARLGAMDCYSYTQNLTVKYGNLTINSFIDGGYANGTYYFHGISRKREWWGILNGHLLREKVSASGKNNLFSVNLTSDELSALMIYEPVKLAIRALGSSNNVTIHGSWLICNFEIPLSTGVSSGTFSGTVRVKFDKDYFPMVIIVDGIVKGQEKIVKKISFSATVSSQCKIPEWEKNLEDQK